MRQLPVCQKILMMQRRDQCLPSVSQVDSNNISCVEFWFFPWNSVSTFCITLYLVYILTKTLWHRIHFYIKLYLSKQRFEEMQYPLPGQASRMWQRWDSNPNKLVTKASELDHAYVKGEEFSLRKYFQFAKLLI